MRTGPPGCSVPSSPTNWTTWPHGAPQGRRCSLGALGPQRQHAHGILHPRRPAWQHGAEKLQGAPYYQRRRARRLETLGSSSPGSAPWGLRVPPAPAPGSARRRVKGLSSTPWQAGACREGVSSDRQCRRSALVPNAPPQNVMERPPSKQAPVPLQNESRHFLAQVERFASPPVRGGRARPPPTARSAPCGASASSLAPRPAARRRQWRGRDAAR